ncbi:MAG: acetyl-CoA carboxylase, carboxyltransferase subunit beta [Puniceicoccales bacterium]|jgi:acetyl-CoA carboxylase carboxyl transferase subunit beta|nr:acetyl-CoA carboxylase, carboxyltransferase subunit beta [Puniceicoccales bacterium]
MALFGKPKYSTVIAAKRKEIPANVFTKCPLSGEVIYTKELEANAMVVPRSGYHFPLTAAERLQLLLDENTFEEHDVQIQSGDPLGFCGQISYAEKLEENRKKTAMNEAVIGGIGKMNGIEISIAAMDFRFLGASMGCAVGEKITRTFERGAERKIPVIVACASGGARMYEGILSLMQMAKTSAALARLAAAHQPYIAILTNPTMAGVIASFGSLGDIIIAEPGALIGFAGPRVIRETTRQELPDGFQTAEFLLSHGFLDQVVPRQHLRKTITRFLAVLHRKDP